MRGLSNATRRATRRLARTLGGASIAAAVLGGVITSPSTAGTTTGVAGTSTAAVLTVAEVPAVTGAPRIAARPAGCQRATHRFRPTTVTIRRVVDTTRVLARGRDRWGTPKPPPLTNTGKWQFAWDKAVRVGARHGVVRLTAHTYPRWAGTALGNRLLRRLHQGDLLIVRGPRGERVCYRVQRRLSVPARRSVPAYYTSSGPARLGILVCSGTRRGPGDWTHRTIWFARPL